MPLCAGASSGLGPPGDWGFLDGKAHLLVLCGASEDCWITRGAAGQQKRRILRLTTHGVSSQVAPRWNGQGQPCHRGWDKRAGAEGDGDVGLGGLDVAGDPVGTAVSWGARGVGRC